MGQGSQVSFIKRVPALQAVQQKRFIIQDDKKITEKQFNNFLHETFLKQQRTFQ